MTSLAPVTAKVVRLPFLLVAAAGSSDPPPTKLALVEQWREALISSPRFESHAAIDPVLQDIYFVRSSKKFERWRIMVARCDGSKLTAPRPVPFAGPGMEADPAFTPDGKSLLYISTRATGSERSRDLDIWMVNRAEGSNWSAPVRLPEPVNSSEAEWFPRLSPHGWLYFGSNRPGGHGGNDIWRARHSADGGWAIENTGPNINTAGDEYEALPSPDGQSLLIAAADGYYLSRHSSGGWTRRIRLGPEINQNGTEIGALYSPTGRSLLFARDTGDPKSGEFFLWRFDADEDWPNVCRAAVAR